MTALRKFFSMLTLAIFLGISMPSVSYASPDGTEEGDDISVVVDLFILRPAGVAATVGGFVIFVGSLPIALATLSVNKTFYALVVNPARYTFVRKIGEDHMPE